MPDTPGSNLTGIVVAGGRSSRLGHSKPLTRIGGQLVLARIESALRPICTEIILVVRTGTDDETDEVAETGLALRMHVIEDNWKDAGPLAGIEAGLAATATQLAFVTAADHPFVSSRLASAIADAADGPDLVIPRIAGRMQPLHAVYRASVHESMGADLANSQYSPLQFIRNADANGRVRFFSEDEARRHDPNLRSFVDFDTPADLARVRAMLPRREVIRPEIRPGGV